MNVFPEVIGIQLANHQKGVSENISKELFESIIKEIQRWPTIKIIEVWYREEKELSLFADQLQQLKLNASSRIIINYIQFDQFSEYSYDKKKQYYKMVLDELGYQNIDFLDKMIKKSGAGLGEFSLETHSLFIMASGAVSPYRKIPLDNEIIGYFPQSDFGVLLNSPEISELRLDARINKPQEGLDYLRFMFSETALSEFWKLKDYNEQVSSPEERRIIFDEVLGIKHKALRVDLGCGTARRTGFIGVDRFPMHNVDIVADINNRLPFEDNTVDLLYASHSLEHVKDIMFTMNEIYRICKHGAQVCIIVPYSEQKLNYANPYHLQVFNEHTPRFWTDYPDSPIPKEEWVHPQGPNWGLSTSDHSSATIDIRCVKMHFDYFPEYQNNTNEQKLYARKTKIDVCEQIMYHLLVVKADISDEEFLDMVQKTEYYEPPYITIRKQRETNFSLTKELDILKNELNVLEKQKNDSIAELKSKGLTIQQLETEKHRYLKETKKNENQISVLKRQLEEAVTELAEYKEIRDSAIHLAVEKESAQNNRLNKLKNKVSRYDRWTWVGDSFSRLRDDSIVYGFKKPGYRLTLSENLQVAPFLYYKISSLQGTLSGVYIAISSDITKCNGTIGIEILSADESILQNRSVKISECDVNLPVYIAFSDITINKGATYYFRVFASNLEVPLKVYQFVKGKNTAPFMAFNIE